MLTGYTPFYDPTPMKTYENILNGTITYPDYLPPDILDLLQKLIVKDLTQRLGNLQGGSNDVKIIHGLKKLFGKDYYQEISKLLMNLQLLLVLVTLHNLIVILKIKI